MNYIRIFIITTLVSLGVFSSEPHRLGFSDDCKEIVWQVLDLTDTPIYLCEFNINAMKHGVVYDGFTNADGTIRVPASLIPEDDPLKVMIHLPHHCFLNRIFPTKSELHCLDGSRFKIAYDCNKPHEVIARHLTKPFSGRGVAAYQVRGDVLYPRPWPASADGRR